MINLTNSLGVDLSSNNGFVDFEKLKRNGVKWCMLRLGYGSNIIEQDDTKIFDYAEQCTKLNIPFGVYLISYALCESDCKSEVEHAKRVINALVANGFKISLPVAIDIEPTDYTLNNGGYNSHVINFLANLWKTQIKQFGYYPMAYIGFDEWNLMNESTRDSLVVWWAQWWYNCEFPGNKKQLGIWQYGGETNYLRNPVIDGAGIVDQNIMYVDYLKFLSESGLSGYSHLKEIKNEKPILDSFGVDKSKNDIGTYALKQLLDIARIKGIIKSKVDRKSSTVGNGTVKAINEFLALEGYKPNGIAGVNFIKRLTNKIEKEL